MVLLLMLCIRSVQMMLHLCACVYNNTVHVQILVLSATFCMILCYTECSMYVDVPASGIVVPGCAYFDRIGGFLCNSELTRCIDAVRTTFGSLRTYVHTYQLRRQVGCNVTL